jgi:CheY-like chemotaxis protein
VGRSPFSDIVSAAAPIEECERESDLDSLVPPRLRSSLTAVITPEEPAIIVGMPILSVGVAGDDRKSNPPVIDLDWDVGSQRQQVFAVAWGQGVAELALPSHDPGSNGVFDREAPDSEYIEVDSNDLEPVSRPAPIEALSAPAIEADPATIDLAVMMPTEEAEPAADLEVAPDITVLEPEFAPLDEPAIPEPVPELVLASDAELETEPSRDEEEHPPRPSAAPSARAPVVMVVEDDASIRAMLTRSLGTEYCVYEAPDGVVALDMLARMSAPDLFVLDVRMPRMDGLALAGRVRQDLRMRMVPIIFLSGLDAPGDVVNGINAGARQYVTKPFKMKDLLRRVDRALHYRAP